MLGAFPRTVLPSHQAQQPPLRPLVQGMTPNDANSSVLSTVPESHTIRYITVKLRFILLCFLDEKFDETAACSSLFSGVDITNSAYPANLGIILYAYRQADRYKKAECAYVKLTMFIERIERRNTKKGASFNYAGEAGVSHTVEIEGGAEAVGEISR